MEFLTLVEFSKLVSDSSSSEGIFALLGRTVVEDCRASHALVFGTNDSGDFTVLSSYGGGDIHVSSLALGGVCTLAELRSAVMTAFKNRGYAFRAFPLISETGLLGALGVLFVESDPLSETQWSLIEGLTELTAISLNKTYQHQRLQRAFDELRISQDALVRTEKFRALGQMSAGIAHDLKNLLNPLLLYADHLRDAAENRQEVLDISQRMERILGRGLETVERLRDFSRQSPEDSEAVPTDLNSMVREAVEISKPRLDGINLVLELNPVRPVLIRSADCVSAIVNLLFNAADALQGKGTIIVRTGASAAGSWLEVQDNGPGMSDEIKRRILEPFFTTKGDRGTGLGLSIVYAFTQRHGGTFEIESDAGSGARFRMWFPAEGNRLPH
jgi:signal transduction histidine kinase